MKLMFFNDYRLGVLKAGGRVVHKCLERLRFNIKCDGPRKDAYWAPPDVRRT